MPKQSYTIYHKHHESDPGRPSEHRVKSLVEWADWLDKLPNEERAKYRLVADDTANESEVQLSLLQPQQSSG